MQGRLGVREKICMGVGGKNKTWGRGGKKIDMGGGAYMHRWVQKWGRGSSETFHTTPLGSQIESQLGMKTKH